MPIRYFSPRRFQLLAGLALLFLPRALLAASDIYVSNLDTALFKITPAGAVNQVAGGFDPYGIAFNDAGEIFLASSNLKKVVRIATDGTASDFATGLGDPLGLAIDGSGNLYVADFTANTIWKVTPGGTRSVYATGVTRPDGIAFDPSGNLFVTLFSTGRVAKVATNGAVTTFASSLSGPVGVACDSAGNVFVAERDGARIDRFTPDGTKSVFSTALTSPYGLTFDDAGTLYGSDQFTGTVHKLDGSGAATKLATISGEAGFLASRAAGEGTLRNVSTRAQVLTGDNVLIGGFIISGTEPKTVVVRAIGPTLGSFGVAGSLQDPMIRLHDKNGAIIAENDDWKQTQQSQLQASGRAPTDDREAAILALLPPGDYTAIVTGKSATTGVGLVEVYDDNTISASKLTNISTRGLVGVGDNVLIGGFIIGGGTSLRIVVRAVGPSLAQFGVQNSLVDPVLSLFDANGTRFASNDNWRDTQEMAIRDTGLAPQDPAEAAIVTDLQPGSYTAIVSGNGGTTGVGLVEVFRVN